MKKVLILIIGLSLTACATYQKEQLSKSVKVEKYVTNVNNLSVDNKKAFQKEICPASSKTWQDYEWKQLLSTANACVYRGKWKMVEKIGSHLAQKEYLSPWGAYYLSLVAEHNRQTDKAFWMIELAIKKAPDLGILFYQKGRLHWANEEYSLAVEAFNKSIQLKAHIVGAYEFLGKVDWRDQEYAKASGHFQIVLSSQPRNPIALLAMGEISQKKGDEAAALEYFQRLVKYYPKEPNYRSRLAQVFESSSDYSLALEQYKIVKSQMSKKMLAQSGVDGKIKLLESMLQKNSIEQKISKRDTASEKKSSNDQVVTK